MKISFSIIVVVVALLISGCLGNTDSSSSDATTMCYTQSGSTVSLNCYTDSLHSCSSDGKSSLAHYGTWNSCYDDMQSVLNNYKNSGTLSPGPNSTEGSSSSSSSSSSSGSGSGDIAAANACKDSSSVGLSGDPQVDGFCQIAQLDACLHRAGYTQYDTEGRANCDILKSMLSGSSGSWRCDAGCPSGTYPY